MVTVDLLKLRFNWLTTTEQEQDIRATVLWSALLQVLLNQHIHSYMVLWLFMVLLHACMGSITFTSFDVPSLHFLCSHGDL